MMLLVGITAALLLIALGVGLQVLRCRFLFVTVEGLSMQPAYEPGDRVLVRRGATPRRGDVVVVKQMFFSEVDSSAALIMPDVNRTIQEPPTVIKRVAKTCGDTWLPSPGASPQVIPEGYIYLLGDNRDRSDDSRRMGLFPVAHVLGTVSLRF